MTTDAPAPGYTPMSPEEVSAIISVRRERDGNGHHWLIEAQGVLEDAEAQAITFRATPDAVVLGEFVLVRDAGGDRIGHLSSATYHERPLGPAYVTCTIHLR